MAKGRFIKAYLNRWRQLGTTTLGLTPSSSSTSYDQDGDNCCFLQCWAILRGPCVNDTLLHAEEEDDQENSIREEKIIMKRTSSSLGIPKDVPKGHLVVYVGEDYKSWIHRAEECGTWSLAVTPSWIIEQRNVEPGVLQFHPGLTRRLG
ncbi:hypothetical protein C5167_033636 [Papaver somniferum]|uniref:Uncharacterized protein n=1 Tax=Papaver somniferum TaxID=3469 RepID=A0A4Y7KDQ4_PAPSO|nr:hypothetical protein C5167_033636 [Papaver somniferum]